mmetsp:Transcript_11603/g.18933  ORF Transcript_11603/g.18933 Transcript_11603/m.18933 type:complete len:408 (-) Transcript_11603:811-2034(-)
MLVSYRTKLRSLCRTATRVTSRSVSTDGLKRTALYDLHLELGGKMVPFAGYALPVQYDGLGVMKEHVHTRTKECASLFDVSHMGQITWSGAEATQFVEKMVCGDIASLKPGESKLSLVMNESGGIMDDTVITKESDGSVFMVVNGACKEKDIQHFKQYAGDFSVSMNYNETGHLLALQGDGAKDVLSRLQTTVDIARMNFMTSVADVELGGVGGCRITRCGYTGEDGFEISVPAESAEQLARLFLAESCVQPAGLGARDSLRLEAGLCLYGNDLNEEINPVEAGLVWTIGGPKTRRRKDQGFLGADKILQPDGKLQKFKQKRVGVLGMKAPAREQTELYTADGATKIGEITSGGFGPTMKKPIAMGYVDTDYAKDGTDIAVSIRGKMHAAQITKMPFVPSNYFKAEE